MNKLWYTSGMEPVTTVLTSLALARQGIAFLKDNIDSLNDAKSVAESISKIFDGHQQFNAKRYDTSTRNIAEEMIEYKLQQEEMYEMKTLVNLRFGAGFWESIVAERGRRIAEQKEQEKRNRVARMQRMNEITKVMVAIVGGMAVAGAALFGVVVWAF